MSAHQAREIAYVGDRLDNDLRLPPKPVCAPCLSGGPWVYIIYQPASADIEIDSLSALPAALTTLPAD